MDVASLERLGSFLILAFLIVYWIKWGNPRQHKAFIDALKQSHEAYKNDISTAREFYERLIVGQRDSFSKQLEEIALRQVKASEAMISLNEKAGEGLVVLRSATTSIDEMRKEEKRHHEREEPVLSKLVGHLDKA